MDETSRCFLSEHAVPVSINRSFSHQEDYQRSLIAQVLLDDITRFKELLDNRGLKYTNHLGQLTPFSPGTEYIKLWENISSLLASNPRTGSLILDAGGASTLFSFYLAWKGYRVVVVDIDYLGSGLLENARDVSRELALGIQSVKADFCHGLPFADRTFDHVYCLCVLEHLSPETRPLAARELGRVVQQGGILSLTIDYMDQRKNALGPLAPDCGLRFGNLEQLVAQVIRPSGLALLGNPDLHDDLASDWFIGCLFLTKVAEK